MKKNIELSKFHHFVLLIRIRISCTTLFTNNNIKVVIQMHSFQFDLPHFQENIECGLRETKMYFYLGRKTNIY